MYETLSILLGIPGAIDASLNVINRLRIYIEDLGILNDQQKSELQREFNGAQNNLSGIKNILNEFTVSFDELDAWKQIHHISNTFRLNFKESFVHISQGHDRNDFERNIYNIHVKDAMLDNLRMYEEQGQGGPLLVIFSNASKLHTFVENLKNYDQDGKGWLVRTREIISNIKMAVTEGTPCEMWDAFQDLSRHINLYNTLADEAIITGITKYNEIISNLRNQLSGGENK